MRDVSTNALFALIVVAGGCEYVAALTLTAVARERCDPLQHVNQCLGDTTALNCTKAQNGVGMPGEAWGVLRSSCHGDNRCQVIDGWAECVANPEASCDFRVDSRRCRNGFEERCDPLSFYRGYEHWDGQLSRWVSEPIACTVTSPATPDVPAVPAVQAAERDGETPHRQ